MSKKEKENNEVKGLRAGQKVAYGLQDSGCSALTGFINSFGMLYWGNTAGLDLGILGTLILASKFLDGITDVIAGTIIDRTESKHGKARCWMIRTLVFMLIFGVLLFMVPTGIPKTAQYIYFFIVYTVFNDFLYTMNNIAFSTLAVRITRKESDQVQLGTLRFIFATIAGVIVGSATMSIVNAFGGGAVGWRMTAIIYAVFFGICQTICIVSVRELPEDSSVEIQKQENPLRQLVSNIVHLVKNKYFIFHLICMVLFTLSQQIMAAAGIFYMTYILGNEAMLGVFTMTTIALVVGLAFVPALTQKIGSRNMILGGMVVSCVMGIIFWYASVMINMPLMLVSNSIRWLTCSAFIGSATVLIPSKISEYSILKDHVNIEATVFSCVSMGTKIGSGLASSIVGWLLSAGGFITEDNAIQPESAIWMIIVSFAVIPLVCQVVVLVCSYFQKVEQAVGRLKSK